MEGSGDLDRQAVVEVATQYFESWFEGDPDRMRAVLHPALAKRTPYEPGASTLTLDEDTAEGMVTIVGRGPRTTVEPGQDVTILDISRDIAAVKVVSAPFIEYLHLARFGDRWLIVNTLYEPGPGAG
jgi:Putative lumazine-binding